MCNAALQPASDRREGRLPKKQKGNARLSICLGFSSISQVSSQVWRRARLCPSSPRERVHGYVHHERTSAGPGSGLGGAGVGMSHWSANVAGDLILARINSVVPKEVAGCNQGTTKQVILQYSRCKRAGARWSPRFTCLHGEGEGGSVDEASLSSRQDRHHHHHRAGPPVVSSWPDRPPLRDWRVGWMDAHQDRVSRSDQGRAAARTKIDEKYGMKESWLSGWLGVVRVLRRLRTCLPSSPLETGAMKGKKRVSAQNRS